MKKDIFKSLKKLFGKKRRGNPIFGSDPRQDWKKLLVFFSIVNILIILWSGYLFWRINRGDIFEAPSASNMGADTATSNKLKEILTVYNNREKKFEELRLAKPVTVDPGL